MMVKTWVTTKNGRSFEVDLPGKRIVCPTCNGKGTHVNPNVDGNGIDPQEFVEDPEFAESYFSGVYDVTCEECKGRNVVEVVDIEKLTPKMLERYYLNQEIEAAHRQECLAEERIGA